jgi:hypothetical protein
LEICNLVMGGHILYGSWLVAITQRQKTPEEIIDQGGPQGLKTS